MAVRWNSHCVLACGNTYKHESLLSPLSFPLENRTRTALGLKRTLLSWFSFSRLLCCVSITPSGRSYVGAWFRYISASHTSRLARYIWRKCEHSQTIRTTVPINLHSRHNAQELQHSRTRRRSCRPRGSLGNCQSLLRNTKPNLASSITFTLDHDLCGGCSIDKHGIPITDAILSKADAQDAI